MTAFWLILALMVGLAAAAVLAPLWLYRPKADVAQDEINTRIFRERLAELDLELAEGRMSEARYQELRAELERTLLSDVLPTASASPRAHALRWAGTAAAVAVPLLALGYYYVGSYRGEAAEWIELQARLDGLVTRALRQPDSLPEEVGENLPDFTRVLAARVLREGMDDPDSLFLLGASLLQLQAPTEALSMLARAYQLAPERTDIMLGYAQALMLHNDGKLTTQAARLLHGVLQQQPDHQGALMLLGFGAFNVGDYAVAVRAWKPLLAGLDPNSEAARLLSERIQRAEQLAQQPPQPQPAPDAAAAAARIDVTVDLAPELRAQLAPDATLFIFAKAVSGPPMPLAAVRQAATGFPVQVVLDDSKAMMPAMKLSNFREVVVGARISKAGDVSAKPGDLEGLSQPLDLAKGPLSVALTVDRVVQ